MKTILLVALVLAFGQVRSAPGSKRNGAAARASGNLNDYVDNHVDEFGAYFQQNALDPLSIEDKGQSLSATDLFGESWKGDLTLKDIGLAGLSVVTRAGNATLSTGGEAIHIDATLDFQKLTLNASYSAAIMNMVLQGIIEAGIADIQLHVDIDVSLEDFAVTLKSIEVTEAGAITVTVKDPLGSEVLDKPIADAVTAIYSDQIRADITSQMEPVVTKKLKEIDLQCAISGICTTTR